MLEYKIRQTFKRINMLIHGIVIQLRSFLAHILYAAFCLNILLQLWYASEQHSVYEAIIEPSKMHTWKNQSWSTILEQPTNRKKNRENIIQRLMIPISFIFFSLNVPFL